MSSSGSDWSAADVGVTGGGRHAPVLPPDMRVVDDLTAGLLQAGKASPMERGSAQLEYIKEKMGLNNEDAITFYRLATNQCPQGNYKMVSIDETTKPLVDCARSMNAMFISPSGRDACLDTSHCRLPGYQEKEDRDTQTSRSMYMANRQMPLLSSALHWRESVEGVRAINIPVVPVDDLDEKQREHFPFEFHNVQLNRAGDATHVVAVVGRDGMHRLDRVRQSTIYFMPLFLFEHARYDLVPESEDLHWATAQTVSISMHQDIMLNSLGCADFGFYGRVLLLTADRVFMNRLAGINDVDAVKNPRQLLHNTNDMEETPLVKKLVDTDPTKTWDVTDFFLLVHILHRKTTEDTEMSGKTTDTLFQLLSTLNRISNDDENMGTQIREKLCKALPIPPSLMKVGRSELFTFIERLMKDSLAWYGQLTSEGFVALQETTPDTPVNLSEFEASTVRIPRRSAMLLESKLGKHIKEALNSSEADGIPSESIFHPFDYNQGVQAAKELDDMFMGYFKRINIDDFISLRMLFLKRVQDVKASRYGINLDMTDADRARNLSVTPRHAMSQMPPHHAFRYFEPRAQMLSFPESIYISNFFNALPDPILPVIYYPETPKLMEIMENVTDKVYDSQTAAIRNRLATELEYHPTFRRMLRDDTWENGGLNPPNDSTIVLEKSDLRTNKGTATYLRRLLDACAAYTARNVDFQVTGKIANDEKTKVEGYTDKDTGKTAEVTVSDICTPMPVPGGGYIGVAKPVYKYGFESRNGEVPRFAKSPEKQPLVKVIGEVMSKKRKDVTGRMSEFVKNF